MNDDNIDFLLIQNYDDTKINTESTTYTLTKYSYSDHPGECKTFYDEGLPENYRDFDSIWLKPSMRIHPGHNAFMPEVFPSLDFITNRQKLHKLLESMVGGRQQVQIALGILHEKSYRPWEKLLENKEYKFESYTTNVIKVPGRKFTMVNLGKLPDNVKTVFFSVTNRHDPKNATGLEFLYCMHRSDIENLARKHKEKDLLIHFNLNLVMSKEFMIRHNLQNPWSQRDLFAMPHFKLFGTHLMIPLQDKFQFDNQDPIKDEWKVEPVGQSLVMVTDRDEGINYQTVNQSLERTRGRLTKSDYLESDESSLWSYYSHFVPLFSKLKGKNFFIRDDVRKVVQLHAFETKSEKFKTVDELVKWCRGKFSRKETIIKIWVGTIKRKLSCVFAIKTPFKVASVRNRQILHGDSDVAGSAVILSSEKQIDNWFPSTYDDKTDEILISLAYELSDQKMPIPLKAPSSNTSSHSNMSGFLSHEKAPQNLESSFGSFVFFQKHDYAERTD